MVLFLEEEWYLLVYAFFYGFGLWSLKVDSLFWKQANVVESNSLCNIMVGVAGEDARIFKQTSRSKGDVARFWCV